MASLSDICSELADIQPLLQNDAYTADVKNNMVTAVALKITGMKTMNAASAHSLMSTAHAMAIDPAFTKLIEDAINTRLMKPDSSKKENPEQQLLSNILSYLTKQDWIKLEDPSSTPEMQIIVLGDRICGCGVRCFDEQTYRWALTVVLSMYLAQHGSWQRHLWLASSFQKGLWQYEKAMAR